MKLKCTTVAAVCLLTYLLFATPSSVKDTEVYEIDYRGPETHNSRPPPEKFHGKSPYIHHKSSAVKSSRPSGLAGVPAAGNG